MRHARPVPLLDTQAPPSKEPVPLFIVSIVTFDVAGKTITHVEVFESAVSHRTSTLVSSTARAEGVDMSTFVGNGATSSAIPRAGTKLPMLPVSGS